MRVLAPLLAVGLLAAWAGPSAAPLCRAEHPRAVAASSGPWILHGRVVRSDDRDPIPDAEVWVDGRRAHTTSDSVGQFRLRVSGADTLWVRARHLGYFPVRGALVGGPDTAITLEVGMDPVYRGFDLPAERVPTPGYVHVIP